jgi:prolyl oligopeptidase
MRFATLGRWAPLLGLTFFASCTPRPETFPPPPEAPPPPPPAASAAAPKPKPFAYPPAPARNVVDAVHGERVADPYRWLEAGDDPGTLAWTVLENELTRSVLEKAGREGPRKRLAEFNDYARAWGHVKRGGALFFWKTEGLDAQASYCVRADARAAPRVLVDPANLGENGSASVALAAPSADGRWLAYAVARAGSDHQEVLVKDVKAGRDAADRLTRLRRPEIAWSKDGRGFFYASHAPVGGEGEGGPGARVLYHKLGEPQDKDKVVFEASDRAALVKPLVSEDGAWLVLVAGKGGEAAPHEVHAADLRKGGEVKPFAVLKGQGHAYQAVDVADGRLVLITGREAPRGRIVAVDLRKAAAKPDGDAALEALVPQPGEGVVRSAAVAGRKLFVETLERAKSVLSVYDLKGKAEGRVALPGPGALARLGGRPSEPEAIVEYASFTEPRAAYVYDVAKKELKPVFKPTPKFDASPYVVEQVSYPVRDAGRASMFLLHKRDLTPDGARLTYLVARGSPREALVPHYDPSFFLLLERGGVVAVPNVRGGFEAGEPWRSAGGPVDGRGALDDLLAAARWLSARKVTRASRLVVGGAPGPLCAAAFVETPDLFGAALCRSPLADMLRYPKLGAGARLVGDYGDPAEAGAFASLYAYSPYHRAARGAAYPATLITAAQDDVGSAAHARKFVARLQATGTGDEPVLLRVGPAKGQGGEAPFGAQLDEEADRWAFVFSRLGPPDALANRTRGGSTPLRPLPPSSAEPAPARPTPERPAPPPERTSPPARPAPPPTPPPASPPGAPIGGGWDVGPANGAAGSPGSRPAPAPSSPPGAAGAPALPPGAVEL